VTAEASSEEPDEPATAVPSTRHAATASSSARPPVMNDVARRAGVSHQTVSRVLNAPSSVRPPTRARVEAAIAELGYRRNLAARSLVTRRSHTLGVVAFDTDLHGPSSTLWAVERGAREAGFSVTIASVPSGASPAVRACLDRLVEQSVEGVVLVAPLDEAPAALGALPPGLPVVITAGQRVEGVSRASVDQVAGARLVVEHLLEAGHRTVHHVGGPRAWDEAVGRRSGWEQALRSAGRPVPEVLTGDWTPASGHARALDLDGRGSTGPVTAVFAANDHMALGVLRALRERGLRVPEDVSVVGFDDVPEAAYFAPPLTTVRQDFDALGLAGVRLLLEQLRTGVPGGRVVVPARLVVRASTAAPGR